jgi:hypothetical protein
MKKQRRNIAGKLPMWCRMRLGHTKFDIFDLRCGRLLAIAGLLALFVLSCEGNRGDVQAEKHKNYQDSGALMNTPEQKQYSRVIIQFEVPELRKLQNSLKNTQNPAKIEQIEAQMATDIKQAADTILERLGETRYRVNRRYSTLPLLALDVSTEALEILKSIPDVLDIKIDELTPLSE